MTAYTGPRQGRFQGCEMETCDGLVGDHRNAPRTPGGGDALPRFFEKALADDDVIRPLAERNTDHCRVCHRAWCLFRARMMFRATTSSSSISLSTTVVARA